MAKYMEKLAIREQYDYIPAARERAWGLFVSSIGRHVAPPLESGQQREPLAPGQRGKGRVLRDYALIYLTDGHGSFKGHDSGWRRVGAGDILVLFPGIWHDYHPSPETGWTERWVLINGDLVNQWCMYDLLCVDNPVLSIGVHDEIIDRFDRLLEIGRTSPPFTNQIQVGISIELLALILKYNQSRHTLSKQSAPIIESAISFLAENWDQEIDFEAWSKKMGVGYRHFRRIFQEATGLPPHQYQLNLRLNHAKRLLGSLPVSEVAARVGFTDPLYFSRLFKSKVGVAPTRWH